MRFVTLGLILVLLVGCKMSTVRADLSAVVVERTIPKYEEAGQKYGRRFAEQRNTIKPGNLDSPLSQRFIEDLCDKRYLGYFNVHSELKEAFKRGFRVGYEDRTADLVLGPHITAAAGKVGKTTSSDMVASIAAFDKAWEETLTNGIEVFIVLISEGSQSDRKIFIENFNHIYKVKYEEMARDKSNRQRGLLVTEGGTLYKLDADLNAIQMPTPDLIKNRFYSQAFVVMGDEWGRRYGTNLVKRDDLVDMLRRCKPALEEGEGAEMNLMYIYRSFAESYKADFYDTFKSIMKDAGIKEKYSESVLAKSK